MYVLETIALWAKKLHEVNLLAYERRKNQCLVD